MAKTKDDFKMQRDALHGISSSEPKVKEKRSMKYLDPKTDLTFKKIFYKHPDLLISLLNALLPLSDDEQIKSIKYLPTELVPQLYLHKNSIVDVLCVDAKGRKFCVEMQMEWSKSFMQRVLFNASKLYVTQAMKKDQYSELQPVYSLNLVNDTFEYDMPNTYIHNYNIVHDQNSKKVIKGLHFTFIELPKFTPHTITEKKMTVLWLRFLTEIDTNTEQVPTELKENPEIQKALEELKVTGFTEEELRAYEKLLDNIRVERTLQQDSYEKGVEEGMEKGMEKGIEQGVEIGLTKGQNKDKFTIAQKMLSAKLPYSQIIAFTGLTEEQLKEILDEGFTI